jgi:hypothetical protein
VRPERLELPTYCSGGNRSIHLSYGRANQGYNMAASLPILAATGARFPPSPFFTYRKD